MPDTLTYTGELTVVTCWCGMAHAIPSELRSYQLREHADGRQYFVYCPLGHTHTPAGEGAAAIARKRAAQLERQLANRDEDLRAERASHSATKGALTKARKRADAGVCQHCHRSFANVARHVATKHPAQLQEDTTP